MTQTNRKLSIHLEIWTDGDAAILANPELWRQLLLGENPSFSGPDREPLMRVQGVEVFEPSTGQATKEGKGTRPGKPGGGKGKKQKTTKAPGARRAPVEDPV